MKWLKNLWVGVLLTDHRNGHHRALDKHCLVCWVRAALRRTPKPVKPAPAPIGRDQRMCGEEGCDRRILFVPGTGFGAKGEWQHEGGMPLGRMRAHMARPKIYVT